MNIQEGENDLSSVGKCSIFRISNEFYDEKRKSFSHLKIKQASTSNKEIFKAMKKSEKKKEKKRKYREKIAKLDLLLVGLTARSPPMLAQFSAEISTFFPPLFACCDGK